MKKTIVIITPYFAPAWSYGGPPKVLHLLAKELIRLDYEVNVITTDALDERRNSILQEQKDGINIFRNKNLSNYLAYKYKLFYIPGNLKKVYSLITRADFILFSDLRPIIHWQLYKFVLKNKIPYGIFAFGQIPYDLGIKALVKKLFDKLWVKDFVRQAKLRFYQTDHERDMYLTYFDIDGHHTHFLPLPVEINVVNNNFSDINQKYGLHESDRVILFVGRFNYLKGIDILINSITPLIKKEKDIKLFLVGRDDGEEVLIKKNIPGDIKNNIIFTGPTYDKEIKNIYARASCFVLTPRYYEETSLASLEALSFGVPVVVTKEANIPYLKDYKAGLVTENNPRSIRFAVNQILRYTTKERQITSQNAKRLIQDYYNSANVTAKLLGYIKKTKNR